jgi:hypothetical protein
MKALLILLFLIFPVYAQNIEYGDPSELKGVTRVFVDTGTNMKLRKEIIDEIEKSRKKIPDLVVTSSIDDAEVILVFNNETSRELVGASGQSSNDGAFSSSAIYRTVREGQGVVYKKGKRPRVLMSFEDTQKHRLLERHPSTNFAREFIKQYKKANGIK